MSERPQCGDRKVNKAELLFDFCQLMQEQTIWSIFLTLTQNYDIFRNQNKTNNTKMHLKCHI